MAAEPQITFFLKASSASDSVFHIARVPLLACEQLTLLPRRSQRRVSPLRYNRRMLERSFERLLFACRWLLAPMYLGLSLALLALTIKFFQEAVHSVAGIFALAETDLVLSVLSLIDLALVGSLIVMVMLAGYENFVSKIDAGSETDTPEWLGKLDSGTLKLKVAASIVAISSI